MYSIQFPEEADLVYDKWVMLLGLDDAHLEAYDVVGMAFKNARFGEADTKDALIKKLDDYIGEGLVGFEKECAAEEKTAREWRWEMYSKKEDYEVRDRYNIRQLFQIENTEDLDSVLDEVMELDRIGYKTKLDKSWYKARYEGNCRIAIARDNGKLIGYCLMAGITPKLFIKN